MHSKCAQLNWPLFGPMALQAGRPLCRRVARLLSVIFVTHDIGAALEVADRIAVMYAGRIVEVGSARATHWRC